ncbi:UNVERIFIED_CONTAM: hypothetical protein FKN15_012661 [Acipenser sinensis]
MGACWTPIVAKEVTAGACWTPTVMGAKAKHGNVHGLSIMSNGSEVGLEDFDTSNSDADLSLSDYDKEDVEPRTIQTVRTEERGATLQIHATLLMVEGLKMAENQEMAEKMDGQKPLDPSPLLEYETSEQESYSDRGQLGGRLQGVAEIENPLNGIGTKVTRDMFTTEGGQEGPHNDGQPEDIQNKGQLDWLESCCLNNPETSEQESYSDRGQLGGRLQGVAEIENPLNGIGTKVTRDMFTTEGGQEGPHNDGQPEDIQNKGQLDWLESCCLNNPETSEQESYSDRGQLGGRLQGVAEIENPLNGIGTKVTRDMFTTEGGQEGPHNDGQPEDIQNKGQLDWLESCCLNNPETSEQESYSDRGQLGGRLQGVAEIENPLNGIGTKVTRDMFTTEGGQEGPHNDGQPEDIQNKGQLDWLESCCLNNPDDYLKARQKLRLLNLLNIRSAVRKGRRCDEAKARKDGQNSIWRH